MLSFERSSREELFLTTLSIPSSRRLDHSRHCVRGRELTNSQLDKELKPLLEADIDRIIPCHGDVIETGGKGIFESVFRKFVGA